MARVRHTRRLARPEIATLSRARDVDRASALRALTAGELVVYAMRLPDGTVKIGCSGNLANRRRCVAPDAEVLGFMPGTYEEEQAIHASLKPYRVRGREWYHPTPEVLAVVNAMRDEFGLPHIAA